MPEETAEPGQVQKNLFPAAGSWPQIIGSVTAIELLTRGRVRVGTRVRLIQIMYGHQMTEELEVETFERPRRLRLIGERRGMHYERDHVIDRLQIGSRLMFIFTSPRRARLHCTLHADQLA